MPSTAHQRESAGALVVLGSLNMDLVATAPEIPGPGETVLAETLSRRIGGKGANQAVAAAHLGADVAMIGRLGDDDEATAIRDQLSRGGIRLEHVREVPATLSGVAFVTVDAKGENAIVVTPGANARLTPAELRRHTDVIATARVAVTQLETPLETVSLFAEICRDHGVDLIVNAAPHHDLPVELLRCCSYLVVNRAEAAALTGVVVQSRSDAHDVLAHLARRGVGGAVVTLGADGCVAHSANEVVELGAYRVPVVDTTGAGDAFVGAFAGALSHDLPWDRALQVAAAAGAWSCTQRGAQQGGIPVDELQRLIDEQPEVVMRGRRTSYPLSDHNRIPAERGTDNALRHDDRGPAGHELSGHPERRPGR